MSSGLYGNYTDLLALYERKKKECPKGVGLKLQDRKNLFLQFVFPCSGKRSSKACNVPFTEEGIIQAVSKAHRVADALKRFSTASDFWNWYDIEILNKNKIENDLVI